MSVPGIVQSALGDEPVAAQIGLGGEDQLYVTPSRILIYRGEGLLSDETIEEYQHRAERVLVSEGRRKAKITLEHDLEGERSFPVGPGQLDDVLHPVLAGVLSTAGVTDAGETVKQTYRFSELTLIVTSKRLVKHIGNAVWDDDYEEYRFENTTDLDFEEGSVATQVVLEVDGRRERIKAPNESAPEVRAQLEEALFDFYDVRSLEEFRETVAEAEGGATGSAPDPDETGGEGVAFESGLSPLSTSLDDEDGTDPVEGDARVGGDVGMGDGASADASATAENEVGGADATTEGDAGGHQPAEAFVEEGAQGGTGQSSADQVTSGVAPDSAADAGEAAQAVDGADAGAGRTGLDEEALADRLDSIAASVNKQNELLKRHQRTVEKLIDELQRMNE
jgi:hypothetical protein